MAGLALPVPTLHPKVSLLHLQVPWVEAEARYRPQASDTRRLPPGPLGQL